MIFRSKIASALLIIVLLAGMLSAVAGCSGGEPAPEPEPTPAPAPEPAPAPAPVPAPAPEPEPTVKYPLHDPLVRFKIATTTSLYDTGLWYHLEPIFEELANVEMDIVYAGTGIALEYGRRGDVDAIIVHDKAREDVYLEDGYGINRRNFGYNFFLIAGPPDDPAGITGMTAAESVAKLYEEGMAGNIKFVSRGDDSGTHAKEKLIWSTAGMDYEEVRNSGEWYVEAGKGMGPTLLMANELNAYVLADISTFLAYNLKTDLGIEPIVDKDPIFLNVYAAIATNPEMHSKAKIDIANQFINWLISPEVQEVIGTYGEAEYGRSLFFALADGSCDMEGCPPVEAYTEPVPEYTP
jgi:tungstate transport system substrate-binding protein